MKIESRLTMLRSVGIAIAVVMLLAMSGRPGIAESVSPDILSPLVSPEPTLVYRLGQLVNVGTAPAMDIVVQPIGFNIRELGRDESVSLPEIDEDVKELNINYEYLDMTLMQKAKNSIRIPLAERSSRTTPATPSRRDTSVLGSTSFQPGVSIGRPFTAIEDFRAYYDNKRTLHVYVRLVKDTMPMYVTVLTEYPVATRIDGNNGAFFNMEKTAFTVEGQNTYIGSGEMTATFVLIPNENAQGLKIPIRIETPFDSLESPLDAQGNPTAPRDRSRLIFVEVSSQRVQGMQVAVSTPSRIGEGTTNSFEQKVQNFLEVLNKHRR